MTTSNCKKTTTDTFVVCNDKTGNDIGNGSTTNNENELMPLLATESTTTTTAAQVSSQQSCQACPAHLMPSIASTSSSSSPPPTSNNNFDNMNNSINNTTSNNNPNALNYSTNVLLVYRLHDMQQSSNLNFGLAMLCLCYCAINAMLIVVNYMNNNRSGTDLDDDSTSDVVVVSDELFHRIEFWATFFFAVVECCSLVVVNSPKSLNEIISNNVDPIAFKLVLFFNIVATLVPAMMVTLNLEVFEIVSHEIEYLNELTMTFVDLIILWSLVSKKNNNNNNNKISNNNNKEKMQIKMNRPSRQLDDTNDDGNDNDDDDDPRRQFILTIIAGVVALIQLGIYNLMGQTSDGDMVGEVPAHYVEFIFEILSSLILFWFCMDNKLVADTEIGLILYGRHIDCTICDAKSNEFFEQTTLYRGSNNNNNSNGNGTGDIGSNNNDVDEELGQSSGSTSASSTSSSSTATSYASSSQPPSSTSLVPPSSYGSV